MSNKKRNYYVDWWRVQKSTLILVSILLFVMLLISGGVWIGIRYNWFSGESGNINIPKDAGKIISFEGDVRITRISTRETEKVSTNTFVEAGDTIQTQADGKAQVKMIDGSTLSVRPNSTVVIRDSASIVGGTNVRVSLDGGQINVKTEDQTDVSNNIVEVQQTENKLQSQTDASFGINPKSKSGEIRISRGGVESIVGGEKELLKDGEFATISAGKISSREHLFSPPKPLFPASLEQILTSDVNFRWQKPDGNADFSYRLEVASSPFFVADGMLVERDPLNATTFASNNFVPGIYYWRVRGTSNSGQTTEWSEPLRFTIVKRQGNETLSATEWQVENIGGTVYLLSGKTSSGLMVRCQGRETYASSDGSFKLQISAPGSEVTVEIGDEHANKTSYVLSLQKAKVIKQY